MRRLVQLCGDRGGASAAEFALVLPLLLLFLFGIIDVGRLMWTWNQAEKATQMGVRYAVVTNFIPAKLDDNFVEEYDLVGGDPVPTSIFDSTTCNDSACTPNFGYRAAAFDGLVARMAAIFPLITDKNVTVQYKNVGLGFAGDPVGPDVSALVTVQLQGLTFQPLVLFGGTVTLPSFTSSLTMEDGSGTASN